MKTPRTRRVAIFATGVLVLAAVGAVVGARVWLSGEAPRALASRKTATVLEAKGGFLPITWDGSRAHSDGFLATPGPERSLDRLVARNVDAEFRWWSLLRLMVRIDRLHIGELQAAYGGSGPEMTVSLAQKPELFAASREESIFGFDVRSTVIEEGAVLWGEPGESFGAVREVWAKITTEGRALEVSGEGGRFEQTGFPSAAIERFQLRYSGSKLSFESATLSVGGGDVAVSGNLDFREPAAALDLTLNFDGCSVEPFLKPKWRKNFSATFESRTRLRKEPEADAQVEAEGSFQFSDGRLHGLPALAAMAKATETADLRELDGGKGEGNYQWDGRTLRVTDFWAAADNLICLEGEFTVRDGTIDADLKVGVRPRMLEPIPGARQYVFDEERSGYVWAPVHLSGPLESPNQNLKERLVAAARREILGDLVAPITEPVRAVMDVLNGVFGG